MHASARASIRLVCRSRRDGALSRPADFIVSTQWHGCHPFVAALSPSVMAGSSFTYVFPLTASATTYLTTCPITACLVVQARTILLFVSGQLARTPRACRSRACRPRARRVLHRGVDFIISKQASYFSCRSQICNPLMSLRNHCSKIALLA
jgi:hypothetical protein